MSDEQGSRQQNQVFTSGKQAEPAQPTQPTQQPRNVPDLPPEMAGLGDLHQGPAEHRMADDLGFEIPVDVVILPTKGTVYPEGTTLHGLDRLPIKAMTARDEDILTSRALLKNGTVITHLLRSCITNRLVNPTELLSGDRNALLIALRITGYGADYKIETQCPACDYSQTTEFDLTELPVKFLEIQPDVPGHNIFSVDLPVSKKTLQFKFLTGRDEEEISIEQQIKKKKLKSQLDNLITSRFMRQILAVNQREDRAFISRFIQHMPARDSRYFRKFVADNEPGMEMEGVMVCEDCGEASEVDVPIGASFFWPDD